MRTIRHLESGVIINKGARRRSNGETYEALSGTDLFIEAFLEQSAVERLKAFWIGLPGSINWSRTPRPYSQSSIARSRNSGPLSD
jgi:hypothetical protein